MTTNIMTGRLAKRNDTVEDQLGYTIVGKLKIGEPKGVSKSGKPMPGQSIDFFRATGPYAEKFRETLGEKPNMIKIVFPKANAKLCCNHRYEGRDNAGKLIFTSDGVNHRVYSDATKRYEMATQEEYEKVLANGIEVTEGYGNRAKKVYKRVFSHSEILTLRFFIVEMKGIMGVWELSTKAVASSIQNIVTNFDEMVRMAGDNINIVPFNLSVKFHISNKPGSESKYPVLSLVPDVSYESGLKLKEFKDAPLELSELLSDDNISRFLNPVENQKQLAAPQVEAQEAEVVDEEKSKKQRYPEELRSYVMKWGEKEPNLINDHELENLEYHLSALVNSGPQRDELIEFLSGKTIKSITVGHVKAITKWIDAKTDQDTNEILPSNLNTIEQYKVVCEYLSTKQTQLAI